MNRVLSLLSNPSYAGAYVFGRYRGVKSISAEGQVQSRTQLQPIDSWLVLIQEHHSGYIRWDDYLENQRMLERNQTNQPEQCTSGAAREGHALLHGLLLCGHCGRRLSPRYTGNGGIYPVYECTRRQTDTHYSAQCVRIQAGLIDQAVSDRVLEILRPDQIEIALRAVKELERRSQAVDQQWRMRLERLEYQSQLAQRRYEEVDPSNRLVAGTLERRWNDALEELQTARDRAGAVSERTRVGVDRRTNRPDAGVGRGPAPALEKPDDFGPGSQTHAAFTHQGHHRGKAAGATEGRAAYPLARRCRGRSIGRSTSARTRPGPLSGGAGEPGAFSGPGHDRCAN